MTQVERPLATVPGWLNYRRSLVVAIHLLLWSGAFLGAFLLRFEFVLDERYQQMALQALPLVLVLRVASFAYRRLFHGIWRYTGSADLVNLLVTTSASSVLFLLAAYMLGIQGIPRSILIIDWLLALTAVGGVRFGIRKLRELAEQFGNGHDRKRILVVGAGDAGEMLVRDILKSHGARFEIMGFLDDDIRLRGADIHGVRVLGAITEAPDLATRYAVEEIIIAMPAASRTEMRRIVEICKPCDANLRTVPGLDNLLQGEVSLNQIREVAIDDLLGREPISLDNAIISDALRGKRVLVTGAGGSIGSELCRQICRFAPSCLVLVEQSENALFQVHRELDAAYPEMEILPAIADICDANRMQILFGGLRPNVVFHAAAHKHVPMMEANPGEAIKNNAMGTRAVADLAHDNAVERFVMISTDKAVNPTSVMGASKRVAELYVQALSSKSQTHFITVRFGNVLGSSGSVIPIFREQIRQGGPVTVTHPEMRRYFMTIPEACQLVLQAGAMGEGGEIFVLDMGEPVKIVDLARDLISLSGLVPGEDIEIAFSGVRPGEKLFEELSVTEENANKTRHPKIFVGRSCAPPFEDVVRGLRTLAMNENSVEPPVVREALQKMVPEYSPTVVEGSALAFSGLPAEEEPAAAVIPLRRR